jgi:polyhydroxybutyrate depolymerase
MRLPSGVLLGLAFAAAPLLGGRAEAACAQTTLSYTYSGNTRTACLYVPSGVSSGTAIPLMVTIHGLNGNDDTFENVTGMDVVADAGRTAGHPFAVVYPETYPAGGAWDFSAPGDIGYLADLITVRVPAALASSGITVDQTRVYAAAYSEGAHLANRAWACGGVAFAGIGNAGENLNSTILSGCNPTSGIPYIAFHGTDDQVFLYAGGTSPVTGNATYSTLFTVLTWVGFNTMPLAVAGGPTTTSFADTLNNGNSVTDSVSVWSCLTHTVTFYTITGGGHTWPGGTQALGALGATSQDVIASSIIGRSFIGF